LDTGAYDGGLSPTALADRTFVLWVDREWMRWGPDGGVNQTPSWFPPDSQYAPVPPEARFDVTFSSDAAKVALTALQRDGGSGMSCRPTCTLTLSSSAFVPFDASLLYSGAMGPAGGHLLVWQDGSRIEAEVQQNGSGLPILYSWRGELRP
jgi:hypothetical protein